MHFYNIARDVLFTLYVIVLWCLGGYLHRLALLLRVDQTCNQMLKKLRLYVQYNLQLHLLVTADIGLNILNMVTRCLTKKPRKIIFKDYKFYLFQNLESEISIILGRGHLCLKCSFQIFFLGFFLKSISCHLESKMVSFQDLFLDFLPFKLIFQGNQYLIVYIFPSLD